MLNEKKCVPCASDTPLMDAQTVQSMLAQVPEWKMALNGKAIKRRYSFKDFMSALAYVTKIADIAEAEGHHPDIMLGWGYVEIILWTHAISGLHENDFIMASKINQLFDSLPA